MRKNLALFSLIPILFSACTPYETIPRSAEGYIPVYRQDVSPAKTVKAEPPRPTIYGGKIYTVGNVLFQVEQDSGIHIINYANPASPQKLGFVKSFLCKEIT